MEKPKHGGDLFTASHQYGIAVSDWLDLSTGINPDGYEIPSIPNQYYRCLPSQVDRRLQAAATSYYGCEQVVAAAGSQQLIQLLPRLRSHSRVAVPDVGYQEHAYYWQQQGHTLVYYDAWRPQTISELITNDDVDCVVLINPSNPTAIQVDCEQISQWQCCLVQKNGWLIIDEAFADTMPQLSFARCCQRAGVIVLRSLGKFFGLAGIRVGFALCEPLLSKQIHDALGPWSVNGPAQFIAFNALQDRPWQRKTREQLFVNSQWMLGVLRQNFPVGTEFASAGLFVHARLCASRAQWIHNCLAEAGILTRYWVLSDRGGEQALLRFGLISHTNERARQYFQSVLSTIALSGQLSCATHWSSIT